MIFKFNGGYERAGLAAFAPGECLVCGFKGTVFSGDSSEGEYAAVEVCLPCINKMAAAPETREIDFFHGGEEKTEDEKKLDDLLGKVSAETFAESTENSLRAEFMIRAVEAGFTEQQVKDYLGD